VTDQILQLLLEHLSLLIKKTRMLVADMLLPTLELSS
jgi:hypothetical protein